MVKHISVPSTDKFKILSIMVMHDRECVLVENDGYLEFY